MILRRQQIRLEWSRAVSTVRRKLLTIERNGLRTQLDLLEEQRARIEAAIAEADSTTVKYFKSLQTDVVRGLRKR
jgi:hypothetical protein